MLLLLLLSKYTFYDNTKLLTLYYIIKIFLFIIINIYNNLIYDKYIYNLFRFMRFLFNINIIYFCFNFQNVLRNFDFRFFFEIKLLQIYCIIFAVIVFTTLQRCHNNTK